MELAVSDAAAGHITAAATFNDADTLADVRLGAFYLWLWS